MWIPSEFDILAYELSIANKNDFIDNIRKLSRYDNKYKELLEDIIKKSETPSHIPENLNRKDFETDLINRYDCLNSFMFNSTYNAMCEAFNEKNKLYDLEYSELVDTIYKLYKQDYKRFIQVIIALNDNPLGWTTPLKQQTETIKYIDTEDIEDALLKIPYIPLDI